MRTLIITLNILLLSLILYNILSKGDKLLENLENCSPSESAKHNALTAELDNKFNILDRLKKKKKEADDMVGKSISDLVFSGLVQGKSTTKLNSKKDEEINKINRASSGQGSGGSSGYIEPDSKLGNVLSGV